MNIVIYYRKLSFDNKYLFTYKSMSYILQLNDGRILKYPVKDIDFYPTIKDHVIDVGTEPGDIVILNYSDSEYLYKVLTTSYLEISYNLDDFVRIANAVDFLGNDQILELLMKKLVSWFNDPLLLTQFKTNKTKVEDAMFKLNIGPIYWLLRSSSIPSVEYILEHKITSGGYNMAVSDDLSYIVIWGKILPPLRSGDGTRKTIKYIAMYKNGRPLKKLTKNIEFHNITIDNNGTIYTLFYDQMDIWTYPQYKRQFYRNIPNIMVYIQEGRAIGLSQNGKYLAVIGDKSANAKTEATIVEVDTDRVLATVPIYNPSPATIIYDASITYSSPHMNLIFFEYLPQTTLVADYKKNNAVWIVNEATKSWIDIPEENLLLSHSENIICAYDKNTTNKVYEINLYKRNGSNFILLANMVNTYEPIAVSENLLLTRTEDDMEPKVVTRNLDISFRQNIFSSAFVLPPTDVGVNVVNIKSNKIEHQINFPSSARYRLEEVFPGLGNTYLFLITPINDIWGKKIKLVKYRIQPYKLLNDFLVAKLGE